MGIAAASSKQVAGLKPCDIQAVHKITKFILYAEHPDIGKLDTYFFSIAFLYRHCIELGLKATGYEFILDMEWLRKYLADLSQKDRDSDSFRYPFHIVWEPGDWEYEGKFSIKKNVRMICPDYFYCFGDELKASGLTCTDIDISCDLFFR